MVSPCKKKKLDKKGRAPNEASSPKNNLGSRRVKSSKPLSNKKFYLDIKNNSTLRQLEAKLTSLGAKLEVFLVKDVDSVVTDRDDYPRQHSRHLVTPSPFSVSISPATTATDSPTDGVISKRTRSRAEAMLERARQQPQRNTTIDILDNAVAWKIPILPLAKFLVWLEKVVRKRSSEPGVRELRGHYLKVETGSGRPDFKQFKSWPKVSFSEDEPAAFPPPKPLSRHDPQRMTRKVSNKTGKDGSTAPGGGNGYCEICRIHYDQLENHISSSQHTKLVSDPAQYSQFDSLIAQHDLGNVTSLRKSLRIAKSPPVEMGTKHSMEAPTQLPMNGHVTRSKTDKILCNGLSPIEKKKKDSKSGGNSDNTKADKDRFDLSVREKEREKEREREKEKEREKEREREKEKEKEREREKEKEREREKEKEREREREKGKEREKERIKEREKNKEKERENEREREKMREKARERDRETERMREAERISKEQDKGSSEERAGAEHNLRSRPSKQATPQGKRARPSRKRLSVEEKLIEDNRSYYKVEVLNSKLRSTEYFISQQQAEEARVNGGNEEKEEVKEPVVVRFRKVRKTQLAVLSDEAENFMFGDLTRREAKAADTSSDESSSDSDSSEDLPTPRKNENRKTHSSEKLDAISSPNNKPAILSNEEEKSDDEQPLMTLNDITFSFENPPKNEPWMQNYKPNENFQYFPHYHEYPIALLPYEYPPAERTKLLSRRAACVRRRVDRFPRIPEDGKPRKSPRCHASTLAIMSSLMRRRPIRECTANPDFTYEEESRSSFPETVDTSSTASDPRLLPEYILPVEPSGDAYAIALARLACGETSTFQVAPGPCLPVDPSILTDPSIGIESKPDMSVPLSSLLDPPYNKFHDLDPRFLEGDSGSDCSDLIGFGEDGRGVSGRRRKRKRNLTGWPLGKPRKRKPLLIPEEDIKCEPCEIKLEPIRPELLEQFPFRDESEFGEELPVIPIKRGRGRPRKYPLVIPSASFSSPPLSPKSSPKKKSIPRFTFGPRRSCLK